jgi:hypothetical protein
MIAHLQLQGVISVGNFVFLVAGGTTTGTTATIVAAALAVAALIVVEGRIALEPLLFGCRANTGTLVERLDALFLDVNGWRRSNR